MAENHQFCSITPETPKSSSTATDGVTSLAALTAIKTAAHYYVVSEPLSVFLCRLLANLNLAGAPRLVTFPAGAMRVHQGPPMRSESRMGASVLEWAYDDSVCYLHQGQGKTVRVAS